MKIQHKRKIKKLELAFEYILNSKEGVETKVSKLARWIGECNYLYRTIKQKRLQNTITDLLLQSGLKAIGNKIIVDYTDVPVIRFTNRKYY
jgi:hypothetical protein